MRQKEITSLEKVEEEVNMKIRTPTITSTCMKIDQDLRKQK